MTVDTETLRRRVLNEDAADPAMVLSLLDTHEALVAENRRLREAATELRDFDNARPVEPITLVFTETIPDPYL